ncbi:hypothetical protein EVAR_71249_1 [Eumeta japonica]|uniref:Uncharacterized protein n=1 Tax=Eumeta variegata TaxID=151549 RepID=A0A4C1TJ64_EUMVA|nr:hypothetical protein EVAR_71249_1 [Eumeta japonica]
MECSAIDLGRRRSDNLSGQCKAANTVNQRRAGSHFPENPWPGDVSWKALVASLMQGEKEMHPIAYLRS